MFIKKVLVFSVFGCLLSSAAFAMSSTNYQINWDNINTGGSDFSTSTNFTMHDTLGDISGTSTSITYSLSAGYRAGEIDDILSFDVRTQTAATQSAFTAFSDAASTVTVASVAGFSVGDYIGVVENIGFAELVAVGTITDITGSVITVDDWDGEPLSISAVPAGGDDVVYLMNSNAIAFGTIDSSTENVSLALTSVLTDVSTGYTVYIQPDQLLQNGSADVMTTVTDGTVNLGSEEYGTENVGATAVSPGTDLGVTSTLRIIQTSGAASGGISDKIGMLYKLAITGSTAAGTYTQTVFYTLTANY